MKRKFRISWLLVLFVAGTGLLIAGLGTKYGWLASVIGFLILVGGMGVLLEAAYLSAPLELDKEEEPNYDW